MVIMPRAEHYPRAGLGWIDLLYPSHRLVLVYLDENWVLEGGQVNSQNASPHNLA